MYGRIMIASKIEKSSTDISAGSGVQWSVDCLIAIFGILSLKQKVCVNKILNVKRI